MTESQQPPEKRQLKNLEIGENKKMNKQTLLNKLNRRDLPGVGVVVTNKDNSITYYFYEDFSDDKGIDRASRHFGEMIDKGLVRRAEYIHKDHTTIHFWDWDSKKDSFCALNEFYYFNKCMGFESYTDCLQRFITIINGLEYKYDYTPAVNGISAITATLANK
jgi:hypothetical protein